ncbi:uncharacterized protein LOC142350653 [Convolutriloba macropyga]|uniref:uncharacterized protein LOC142350653 n=1 Tax=Convolutriloba macropyga TaxID=536237 RepID=UPI003F526F5B
MKTTFSFVLFLGCLSCSVLASTTIYSCEIDEEHCMIFVDTSNGTQYIDMIPLVTTLQTISLVDNRLYSYQPCGGIDDATACADAKACQVDGVAYNPIGDADRPRCEINPATLNPKVVYFGTRDANSSEDTLRGATVEFICRTNTDPYFNVDQYTKIDNTYVYPFSLYGAAACPIDPKKRAH